MFCADKPWIDTLILIFSSIFEGVCEREFRERKGRIISGMRGKYIGRFIFLLLRGGVIYVIRTKRP